MRWAFSDVTRGILINIFFIFLLAVTACSTTPATAPAQTQTPATMPATTTQPAATAPEYTINIANKAGIGDYLVDSKGMTIYYFLRDSKDKSNATAAIIKIWPVFYVANVMVPAALNAADFGTITRDDGSMQSTYKGWPLYYYIKDQTAGDTMGQQFNNLWFVVTSNADFMSAPAAPETPVPTPTPNAPATSPQPYTY